MKTVSPMGNRARSTIALLAVAGALLAGCELSRSAAPKNAAAEKPIWVPVQAPRLLSGVDLLGGTTKTVDVTGSVPGEIERIEVAGIEDAGPVQVAVKDRGLLELSAPRGTAQQGIVNLRVTTADGAAHSIGFPVSVTTRSTKVVTFDPKGKEPKTVCIAGRFNGWSMTANPLHRTDGDGTWEAEIPVEPGVWPYKLVVDGEWILDPANPETMDDGGHVNSRMTVEGEKRKALPPLPVSMLPASAPGVGAQGGLKIQLADGARLDPARTRVFVDNATLPASSYCFDASAGVIALSVPADKWGSQQFVSAVVADTTGRTGTFVAPFDFAASPRSPKDDVIYYVVLDRFANGDSSNDAPVNDPELFPLNNFLGGDIAGVRQAINSGYFGELGATTLWISPPFDQPDTDYREAQPPNRMFTGYHGYWPVNMRDTEKRWGTMDEFKGMVADAHRQGIAIIIDFVSNHLHEANPLVKQHPDWFSQLNLPDGPNIRKFDEHPFSTWFDSCLPDIDYSASAAATEYMTDSAVWWIKETNADGFRHDAVKHVPLVFWEMCTRKLDDQIVKPQHKRLYQVGETISSRPTINQFIGPKLLDGQFDFPLFWVTRDAFAWEKAGLDELAKTLQDSVDQYPPDAVMSPLIGSHDVPRFMGCAEFDNKPGKDKDAKEESYTNPAVVDDPVSYRKLQLAFSFLLTIPGAPMMYYGDEIGMTGVGSPDNRRMFIPRAEWNDDNKGTFAAVSRFLHARNQSIALRRGQYQFVQADKETLVFARVAPEEAVLVVIQRSPARSTLSAPLPAGWGNAVRLEPLVLNGLAEADVAIRDDGRLEVAAKPYSAGVWRVKW